MKGVWVGVFCPKLFAPVMMLEERETLIAPPLFLALVLRQNHEVYKRLAVRCIYLYYVLKMP
jgi:hypothetical protein